MIYPSMHSRIERSRAYLEQSLRQPPLLRLAFLERAMRVLLTESAWLESWEEREEPRARLTLHPPSPERAGFDLHRFNEDETAVMTRLYEPDEDEPLIALHQALMTAYEAWKDFSGVDVPILLHPLLPTPAAVPADLSQHLQRAVEQRGFSLPAKLNARAERPVMVVDSRGATIVTLDAPTRPTYHAVASLDVEIAQTLVDLMNLGMAA